MARKQLTAEQRQRLVRERERLGLSQRALARRAGTVSQVVNQLESGAAHASAELLQRIGDELGLDITVEILIKRKRRE